MLPCCLVFWCFLFKKIESCVIPVLALCYPKSQPYHSCAAHRKLRKWLESLPHLPVASDSLLDEHSKSSLLLSCGLCLTVFIPKDHTFPRSPPEYNEEIGMKFSKFHGANKNVSILLTGFYNTLANFCLKDMVLLQILSVIVFSAGCPEHKHPAIGAKKSHCGAC